MRHFFVLQCVKSYRTCMVQKSLCEFTLFLVTMANIDEFLDLLKKEFSQNGITNIDDAQNMAQSTVEMYKSKIRRLNDDQTERLDDDDYLPIFSHNGEIVHPNRIDHTFETLDDSSGIFLYLFCDFASIE